MTSYRNKTTLSLIPVLIMLFTMAVAQDKADTIAVSGLSVTQKELDREIQRCRAVVISKVVKEHNLSEMKGFWSMTFNGQKPMDILRQKALDTLVFFKVQEQLLKEQSLWPYNNYNHLLEDLDRTNKLRTKAIKEGTTIYGPVNYTEQSFYDYQFGNSVIRLKEKLLEKRVLQVDEDKLMIQFEKMKKTVYKKDEKLEDFRRQVHAAYVEEAYVAYIKSLVMNMVKN